jgi:hypothetical protein
MNIKIIGGGTFFHVRNHLALAAPAYTVLAKRYKVGVSTVFEIVKEQAW